MLWSVLIGFFRSRASLEAENLALRQQIIVLRRTAPKWLRFNVLDRVIFVDDNGQGSVVAIRAERAWAAVSSGWTERLRRREVTIAVRNDRGYLFEGREEVPA